MHAMQGQVTDKAAEDDSFLSIARLIVDDVLIRYGIELSADDPETATENNAEYREMRVEREPVRITRSDAA